MMTPKMLSTLYQQACEVELQAFKPGNVSIYAAGHDMTVRDFRISAEVSAAPLCNPDYSLGEKIFYAVKATREAVGCNTNLGIILLCAPLIQAASRGYSGLTLRRALNQVLGTTTIDDANWVFKAITVASPGGLGGSNEQDVHDRASVTLTEAMKLAGSKDRVALQYITDYKDIFDFAVIRYNHGLIRWGKKNWAAVAVYADLLSQFPDSHIERKYGHQYSEMIADKMALLNEELSKTDNPERLIPWLYCMDQEFKSKGVNPGTTADMTVATVLAVFLEDIISHN
ncbi:MAG: triphosphoribosyl-dephospho-CoA synthase [Methylobacter sp.]|nr:triphosphoribosyl-dephospho-CoA synthase [Methylobacter sp.]